MAPQSEPDRFPIPKQAMTDCGAILGKRGTGKSSLARFLLEHEVDIGHRCCFIDPMGDAAGVRLNPDTTPSRFSADPRMVLVFGGRNGDIPISDEDGGRVGRIVATHNISCIVDLSGMIQAEQLRFMTDFADLLFETIVLPVTLFVDEAHIFAPQERGEASAKLLNRMARLNSQGRKKGIFLWLMTQRPARINKNILGGTETFIGMKVMMPQDIAAIGDWFEANGPAAAKDLRAQLPKLKVGEAFVFASGSEFFGRVQFPMHSTLDTGKTPLHGETVGGVTLPKVDVSALAADFGRMTGGDERDDLIEELQSKLSALQRRYGDLIADFTTTRTREDALIALMLDLQLRIGSLIGSAKIVPLPAGERHDDYLFLPSGGEVRPFLREGDNSPLVGPARTRMAAAKLPTKPAPKGSR